MIELLVVVAIVGLLAAILAPSLSGARDRARATVCGSNLRQLVLANQMYGNENSGRACPGAAGIIENLRRWHGTRDHPSAPFDAKRGPLVRYLGADGRIRACPSFRDYVTDSSRAFELGNGGFGYNNAYVGVILRRVPGGSDIIETDNSGVPFDRIRNAADTLMFADAAFAADDLIEYSFAEPRFHPTNGYRADPSIHFRHRRHANVGWCDGHVDAQGLAFTWSSGLYLGDPGLRAIGWFGVADDNHQFDLD